VSIGLIDILNFFNPSLWLQSPATVITDPQILLLDRTDSTDSRGRKTYISIPFNIKFSMTAVMILWLNDKNLIPLESSCYHLWQTKHRNILFYSDCSVLCQVHLINSFILDCHPAHISLLCFAQVGGRLWKLSIWKQKKFRKVFRYRRLIVTK